MTLSLDEADTMTRRWAGVGSSAARDAHRAGFEAATKALLDTGTAALLVVFCSSAYDAQALLAGVHEVAGDVPLVGCSTAGEIATGGPGDGSVVVWALGGEGLTVSTTLATGVSSRLREAGAEVAACVGDDPDRPHRVLLLLTDGLAGDQQEIIRGAYSVVGAAVPLVGGCAGDDMKMRSTQQFHGRTVHTDAIVAVSIESVAPFGVGVRHGWRKVGEPMLVTGSSGNRVHTLNERPALDVYLDKLDAPADVRVDASAFTRFALTHPFGIDRRTGEEQIRFVGGADVEDRSIATIAEVPEGALVWLMEGDADSALSATDAACDDAFAALAGRAPVGVLAFDCIARRGVLGDEGIAREVARVAQNAHGAPVAGFYTYGEIARTRGVLGFHNQTIVVLAVS